MNASTATTGPARALQVLSLFSGIGGLELGLERAGMRTVGQVEIDPYCQRVLAKHWPDVPRHDDVRTAMDWWSSEQRPRVDVVCGGFPCQDISLAGRRAGIVEGTRSSLWSYMAAAIRVLRPRYVVMENVAAILVRDRDGCIPVEFVAADLAEIGYDLRGDCVPASALGAPHRRDRWFGVAYPHSDGLRLESVAVARGSREAIAGADGTEGSSADVDRAGLPDVQGWGALTERAGWRTPDRSDWWGAEPAVGRVVHGVSSRLDRRGRRQRIHALGNAVVPQVAEYVGRLVVEHAQAVAA